ncbi:MAG: GNAT family N-acetyltransferase [Gemmatimonadales bacterium]
MALEIVALAERPADWDTRIREYGGKTLFHESVWLDHVASITPTGKLEYAEIRDSGKAIGVVCGVRQRRAFVTILGSPLPGTGTNFGGPLVADPTRLPEVLGALIEYWKNHRVMHLELAHPDLDRIDTAALGLEAHPGVTHVIPLPDTEAAAWQTLKSTCRNRVRKAEKAGLICEVTSDPAIVDHFYRQYQEVYAKQGLALPMSRETIQSVFDRLVPKERVLPIWVRQGDEVLAAGLFPFDENAIYFWGAASWLKYQALCPNELLHWNIIKLAVARGIPLYNMCGGTSQFKDKFGGSDVPNVRCSLSYAAWLAPARRLYLQIHRVRLRVLGLFRRRPVRETPPEASDAYG